MVDFLESVGATARPVLPYVYAPAADAHRVVDLIHKMAAGEVDAIIFTSSAQSDRLFEVAKEHNLESELRQGLDKVRVAAVGPVMAETLHEKGVRVDVCPEQGFVMKNLVTQLGRAMNAHNVGIPCGSCLIPGQRVLSRCNSPLIRLFSKCFPSNKLAVAALT